MRLETATSTTDFPIVEASSFDEARAARFSSTLAEGITAARNGEREKARELLTRATDINPQSENAWMWLASLSEYPEELLSVLKNVLKINPDNERALEWQTATLSVLANVFVGRGVKAHAEGSVELAVQLFDQALKYDDRCELAWFWKSSITRNEEERLACLRRVLEINPQNDDARKTLDSLTRPVEQPEVVEPPQTAEINEVYDYQWSSPTLDTGEFDANELGTLDEMSDPANLYAADDERGSIEEPASPRPGSEVSDEWKADDWDQTTAESLPVVDSLAADTELASAEIAAGENRGATPKAKTILVVDDSPTVRKLIAGKLEKSGHFVRCAGDGVEGLASIEEKLPDLVLLDISMPGMDGYDMCKKIRSHPHAKDLPVVMISGKDGFFDETRGRMAGCSGYITKPFGPETLMKALEAYLTHENETSE
jgi:CheY-like chemotaxis protein